MSGAGLHTLAVGTAGPRVAFLHGLFGQGRNWNTIAKALAGPSGDGARSLLIDLPDHGRSPWTDEFSYPAYAQAVADTLSHAAPGESWIVVGHSLGGKVAMMLALRHPELVTSLVVVDIAPKDYGDLDRFRGYIDGMRALPLPEISSRADADERFAQVESDAGVRGFLLQNLRRHGDSWRWQPNLDLIAADADRGDRSRIAEFPAEAGEHYDGPVTWLIGEDSGYVRDADVDTMRDFFPKARPVLVKGASHWVHSDAPDVVIETLRRVLRAASRA